MGREGKDTLNDIQYVKLVTVGSVNPTHPLSDESREQQVALLNKCLSDYPKGMIIGTDRAIGRYMIGEHELVMEKITYHVGFTKKPLWEDEQSRNGGFGV